MVRKTFRLLAGAGTAAASVAGCASPQAGQKPNIVFFFADDIGVECFGCYGGAEYRTPNIDALADCYCLVQVNVFGNTIEDVSALRDRDIIVNYNPTAS